MFNFFKKKQGKGGKFNVYDESTWGLATDSSLILNGRTVKPDDEKEDFTEKELVKAIDDVIRGISSHEDARKTIQERGRGKIIARLINNMAIGATFSRAVDETVHWMISTDIDYIDSEPKIFNILDINTWDYASTSQDMIWNGNKLSNADNKPHTEQDIVDLARAIFKFLERNGDIILPEKKIAAIKTLLNRMENPEYYAQLYEQEQLEKDKSIPDGLFNPRDPETYKYAKNKKPLVIDGVQIFRTYIDATGKEKKEVKEYEMEKSFVSVLSMSLKMNEKSAIWEKAIELVKADFIKQGIKEPSDRTPGYTDRINNLYQSMLKDYSENTEKYQEYIKQYNKKYIESHIRRKVAECSPKILTYYGGYGFSEAQMEVLDGCSVETFEKVGKIMSTNKNGSKLKQEIFNSLAINGYWVVALRDTSSYPDIEEGIMHDFYLGYEDFSSEQDVHDFYNSRPYLEKRPELKQKVIESVIDLMKDLQEAEEKYIAIRKGKSVQMIEKGTQIPDGWSLIDK